MGFLAALKKLGVHWDPSNPLSVELPQEYVDWIDSHPDEWKAMQKKYHDEAMLGIYGPNWRKHKAVERLHFFLHDLIEREWYKKGDPGARESLILACQRQIDLAPRFAQAWREENKAIGDHRFDDETLPGHAGFSRLISLMWKEENFAEAIRLAELASAQGWARKAWKDWEYRAGQKLRNRLLRILKSYKTARRKAEIQERKLQISFHGMR